MAAADDIANAIAADKAASINEANNGADGPFHPADNGAIMPDVDDASAVPALLAAKPVVLEHLVAAKDSTNPTG
ncbi:hypothetical protein L7F22_055393 [Adiantum nelumboides]|nr:hypothetical protein [Adiantum nelumboides]